MRAKIVRYLTAFLIIIVCIFAASRGFDILRFSVADQYLKPGKDRTEAIAQWVDVSSLAFPAREALLTPASPGDISSAVKRRVDLEAILSIRPLSSRYWLALSQMMFITGQPENEMLEALRLSLLTGPNEGYVMIPRGIFGLALWERLPTIDRSHIAVDIGTAIQSDANRAKLEFVLLSKAKNIQEEVRDAVILSNPETADEFTKIGLGPASSVPPRNRAPSLGQ